MYRPPCRLSELSLCTEAEKLKTEYKAGTDTTLLQKYQNIPFKKLWLPVNETQIPAELMRFSKNHTWWSAMINVIAGLFLLCFLTCMLVWVRRSWCAERFPECLFTRMLSGILPAVFHQLKPNINRIIKNPLFPRYDSFTRISTTTSSSSPAHLLPASSSGNDEVTA